MPTIISESTHVRGRIQGNDDLEIDGFVEGEIAIEGDILVGQTGRVGSALVAHHIVIRGAVRGDVTGSASVSLEDGARVLGDIRAPRVSIADGALVRGHVEAGAGAGSAKKAPVQAAPVRLAFGASTASTASTAAPAVRMAPAAPAPVAKAAVLVAHAAPAIRAPEPAKKAAPPALPAKKTAPAPVVPVLKQGAKAVAKKSR